MLSRCKTPHAVVTFDSTADAMAVQAASADGSVPGRMIPVPSEISAGCGLAWSTPANQQQELEQVLQTKNLSWSAIKIVDLY